MTMRAPLLCAVLLAGSCGAASAQTPAPAPSAASVAPAPRLASPPDLASALDPYDPAAERTRFLRAVGIDNELDANEFEADRSRPDAFVRKFDHWEELLKYDKDKNGRIDWFEADAYRQAFHEGLLGAFDENKDGRLAGPEREAANQALGGENPFAQIAARAAHAGQAALGTVLAGGEDSSLVYTPPDYKVILEKFDKDGDGKLSDEEKQAARQFSREDRQKWELEHFDKDGDGKLSDEERKAMWEQQARARQPKQEAARADSPPPDANPSDEERKAAEARRQGVSPELLQKYDADGDGKLSDEERKAMKDDLRKQWEGRQKEMLQKYDADGDGKLNDEERKKMMEDLRGQGRGMGGRGSSDGGR